MNQEDRCLPQSTLEYLAHGATNGERNSTLMAAACQFRDARYSIQESVAKLLPRASADGLAESEILATIRSAFKRAPREACAGATKAALPKGHISSGNGTTPTYRKQNITPEPLPQPLNGISAIQFLQAKFAMGEWVSIGTGYETRDKKGKLGMAITGGECRTRETWIADIQQRGLSTVFPCLDGVFVRVNPMKNGNGKCDADVAMFREALVESDEGSLEEQLGAIRRIELPISALGHSGGRSIQASVIIDAPDEEVYRERFCILRQYCMESLGLKMDAKNINPSRYCRLPGVKRIRRDHETCEKILDSNGHEILDTQTLFEVNIPGKPWDEWFESLPVDDGDNTEWFDLDALFSFDRENDPDNVVGNRWICRGDSFILQGYTGIGKSSFVLQIAIYLALGKPLFGCIKVKGPLKVLIIQAENNAGDMAEPLQDICEYALKLSEEEKQRLKANLIIGRQSTKSGAVAFASYVEMLIRKHKPDVCIFDPLLSYFGKDLSSQEAASEFFRAYLQPIQNRTGIIMGFVHHLGKPPKSSDQRQGPILYSGLGSSDIFNWAREVMTLVPDEDFHKLDLGKRGFRAGIVDEQGKPITEIRVQRASAGRCYWSVADSQPKAGDQTKASKGVDLDKALEQVPLVEPEHKYAVIKKIAAACKVGMNPARQALTQLILSEKVEDVDIENPKKTGQKGRSYAGVIKTRRETS